MLQINWKTVTGTQERRPELEDTASSPTTVYLRKNVRRTLEQGQNAEAHYVWQYEEAALSLEEYEEYKELVAQIETPAIQHLQEQNGILMAALADMYEKMEKQEETNQAILFGLADLYEAQGGEVE